MGVWYRAGTVAVTSGSKTVTGTNTQWQNLIFGVAPGATFYGPDGKPYEIDTVNSNTSLTLATNYSGTTASGQAYAIDPTRSGSVASLAAQTSEVLKFSQGQFTQIQNWFTGAASANVTLTSPAGQQITVPSYSKVTSEGEGQAARAKTEADKAAASAALAGDIVAASALPLPDVWAPLSDSLRLITGYGRDVLVGSDVVARMVNFSRSSTATYIGKDGLLRTAAQNEPRFEKEGLLIEGQSTNLWPSQAAPGASVVNAPLESVILPTGVAGNAYKVTPNPTDYSYVRTTFIQQTGQFTLSCFARKADGSDGMPTLYTGISGALSIKASGVYLGAGWWRMYALLTNPVGNTGFGFLPAALDPIPVHICFFQLEALPFASSYIPTNGAAVTRTKDVLYLAPSGNVPGDLNMAFAAQIKMMGYGVSSWPRVFEISGAENKGPYIDLQTGKWGGVNISGVRKTLAARFSDTSHWVDGVKVGSTWPPYPVKTYSEPVYIAGSNVVGSRDFYGHIRNLRVWFLSLTDDQMKALR